MEFQLVLLLTVLQSLPLLGRNICLSNACGKVTFWILDPLKMGPISCPETSVRNYHYSLRNNSEERSSHLLRGSGVK
jgi:hypothetical protein